jgi:hypothetical protein
MTAGPFLGGLPVSIGNRSAARRQASDYAVATWYASPVESFDCPLSTRGDGFVEFLFDPEFVPVRLLYRP